MAKARAAARSSRRFWPTSGSRSTKFAGFIITGSSSLLAESIHSVADSSNQGLLFLGGRQAKAPPDQLHQFGHGRVRYFWAFVVAVVLFTLGGLFSRLRGLPQDPRPARARLARGGDRDPASWRWCFEGSALRTAVRHATPVARRSAAGGATSASRAARSCRSCCWRTPARCSASTFALLGVLLAMVTGEPVFDGIGTLLIGLLLLCIAVVLAREMRTC